VNRGCLDIKQFLLKQSQLIFFKNKNVSKKTKTDTKEHNNRQNINICIRNLDTNKERLNIFERKVYRGILGPVYDNEKENWRILTNK
jgi:hypothetical protein